MTAPRVTIVCLFVLGAQAEEFRLSVHRDRVVWNGLTRRELGELVVDDRGFAYKSLNGKKAIEIAFPDVRRADVSHPRVIRIETYDRLRRKAGGNAVHSFRLREPIEGDALARFLAGKLERPPMASYDIGLSQEPEIATYHRHMVGGCHGKLQIGQNGVRYLSDRSGESRTWLYRDVESIGSMNAFHFRISTVAETYNLDLKSRLPEETYRRAFQIVAGIKAVI